FNPCPYSDDTVKMIILTEQNKKQDFYTLDTIGEHNQFNKLTAKSQVVFIVWQTGIGDAITARAGYIFLLDSGLAMLVDKYQMAPVASDIKLCNAGCYCKPTYVISVKKAIQFAWEHKCVGIRCSDPGVPTDGLSGRPHYGETLHKVRSYNGK
uniref:Orientotoxin-1 n=1 Tax=Vespa orientalis TaxID=7447 RepID=PAO1_VESOR|nr:RecName: Full=Orientotoxin-1; AltName: Full=Lysophospholipase; AltName: Full=Orientotoxin I [Vespa orientalis]